MEGIDGGDGARRMVMDNEGDDSGRMVMDSAMRPHALFMPPLGGW